MIDEEKKQRFHQYFQAWRPQFIATEHAIFQVAILISNFSSTRDLATIDQDLTYESDTFKEFGSFEITYKDALEYGTILYGKLAIDEYLSQCDPSAMSEGERMLLNELSSILSSLYTAPFWRPIHKIDNLILNTHRWIDQYLFNAANSRLARELCISIYTLVKIFLVISNHLSPKQRSVAERLTNIVKTQAEINSLLNKIMSTAIELKPTIAPEPSSTADEGSNDITLQKLSDYLQTRCAAFVNDRTLPKSEMIMTLQSYTQTVCSQLSELLSQRQNDDFMQTELGQATSILEVVNTFEGSRTMGARELINVIQDNLTSLIRHTTEGDALLFARRLEHRIALLKEPTMTQKASDTFIYTAYLPRTLYQELNKILLQIPATTIQYLPNMFDNETKQWIKAFAESRLKSLSEQLLASSQKQQVIAALIFNQNPDLQRLMSTLSIPELLALLEENSRAYEVISHFSEIMDRIALSLLRIHSIKVLVEEVDGLIASYHGFFSQIIPIVNKTTAIQLNEIQFIQLKLKSLKTCYEQDYKAGIYKIREHPDISQPVSSAIITRLTALEPRIPEIKKLDSQTQKDFGITYSLVHTLFRNVNYLDQSAEENIEDENEFAFDH